MDVLNGNVVGGGVIAEGVLVNNFAELRGEDVEEDAAGGGHGLGTAVAGGKGRGLEWLMERVRKGG